MANHLTPAELADRLRMNQQDVVGKCLELGIPILHGRIDRALFETTLRNPGPRREPRRAAAS